MSSRLETVQFLCDQAGLGARLTYRRMFGEYALYLDDLVIAFVCDDQLFLKPTTEGRGFLRGAREAPPYPGAKDYLLVVSEIDEPDRLREALLLTARALPLKLPLKKAAPKKGKKS